MTLYDFNKIEGQMTKMTTDDHAGNSAESTGVVIFPPPRRGGVDPTFDQNDHAPKDRLSNFDRATKTIMSELKAIDAEVDRLEAIKAGKRVELREALLAGEDGVAEFAGVGRAAIVAGRVSVSVTSLATIPAVFLKTEVDTAKVSKALKAGQAVPGAEMVEGEPTLRIVWAK